jgi:hypothetical protein
MLQRDVEIVNRLGRPRPQFRGQVREGFGTARVAEHHLVPGLDGEPRDCTADLSASDESHSNLEVPVPRGGPSRFDNAQRIARVDRLGGLIHEYGIAA